MSDEEQQKQDENSVEEKKIAHSWNDIIEDAQIAKTCTVIWKDNDKIISYRELVGYEDLEISKKYGKDEGRANSEKVLMMIEKANNSVLNEEDRITREIWERIPARLRNIIILTVIFDGVKDMGGAKDFLPMLKAMKE